MDGESKAVGSARCSAQHRVVAFQGNLVGENGDDEKRGIQAVNSGSCGGVSLCENSELMECASGGAGCVRAGVRLRELCGRRVLDRGATECTTWLLGAF